MTLGEFVRARRQDLNLSLRDLAKRTGLSHSYIANLESGAGSSSGRPISPTMDTLQKLAKGLAIPYEKLERVARGLPPEPEAKPTWPPSEEEMAQLTPERRKGVEFLNRLEGEDLIAAVKLLERLARE